MTNPKFLVKYGMRDTITIHELQRKKINLTTNFLKSQKIASNFLTVSVLLESPLIMMYFKALFIALFIHSPTLLRGGRGRNTKLPK